MDNKYWKGKIVCVVAEVPNSKEHVIIRIVDVLRKREGELCAIGCEYRVKESELEQLVDDAFNLGDKVSSRVGDLTGHISSFEYETNKVVVTSDKLQNYNNKRSRYAYSLNEIERTDLKPVVFAPGMWYTINHEKKVLSVESVFRADQVMLFDKDGIIVYRDIPRQTNLAELQMIYGIRDVHRTKTKLA